MTLAVDSVRTDLAALVGSSHFVTGSADVGVDGKVPDCAVFPTTAEQVAAVLRYAGEHRLAVIPRGGGTKLSTGNPPRQYDIALSLKELNHVVLYEPADLTITVEPGMTFGAFQELVGRNGLWLPLDPRGGAASTMGGIIAANAVGPLRQGFGGPRDMVLGLKIANTDGKVVKTGGRVVKNVAGFDLAKLLTGSFGTLGVIVEASLKLFPKPPERATFTLRAGTLDVARDLRKEILRSLVAPMRLVLIDSTARALLDDTAGARAGRDTELWVELGGSHRVIERCMLELRQIASAVGAPLEHLEGAEEMWQRLCNPLPWLQPKYRDVTVLRAAFPLVASENFMGRAKQAAEAERLAVAGVAQAGVGIVHLYVLEESLHANVPRWVTGVRQTAAELGGTLVVEHCPVDLKGLVDIWGAVGDDLGAMRKMKAAWDPADVLAPGRFLGF